MFSTIARLSYMRIRRLVFLNEHPTVTGGAVHSTFAVASALKDQYSLLLFTPGVPSVKEASAAAGMAYVPTPVAWWSVSSRRPLRSMLHILKLQSVLRGLLRSGDCLIVNGVLGEFVAGFLGRLKQYPRIYFVRGAVGGSMVWSFLSFKGLSAVVAVSSFAESEFKRRYPKLCIPIFRIPNFVSFVPKIERKPLLQAEAIIGCVGVFNKNKNQALLLRALKILRGHGHDCKVALFGQPGCSEDRRYLIVLHDLIKQLGLEGDVVFPGYLSYHEIYNSIDCLVSTSKSEGFGRTLMEAMAYGVPVVAFSGAGGPIDIIDHRVNGLLLDHHDPKELANALEELMLNPSLRSRLVMNAKQKVENEFSIDSFRRRFGDLMIGVFGGER